MPSAKTLLILVLSLFFLGYDFPGPSSSAPTSFAEERETTNGAGSTQPLLPGQLVRQQISGPEPQAFQLQVPSDQYVHLALTQQGTDLQITVSDPNGQTLVQCLSRDYGPTPISFISGKEGNYRIEVRLRQTTTAVGRYTLRSDKFRGPLSIDRQRVAAEQAFNAGENLRARGNADSLNGAIRKYEEAANAWHTAGPQPEEIAAIESIGRAYFRLGDYKTALKYFQQTLQLRRSVAGTEAEGEILNHLGYALMSSGSNEEGLRYCTEALRVFQRLRVPRGEAQSLSNLGEVYYAFSQLERSLDYHKKALPIWERLGDLRGQAQTLMNFGIDYSLLRDPVKATQHLQKALVAWKQVNDRRGEALTLTVLGTEYTRTGEWQKAGDLYDQALKFFQESGDRFGLARTYNCIAYLDKETGQQQAALELYNLSLPLFVAIGHREAEAGTRLAMGSIYIDKGEKERALGHFVEALRLARTLKDPLMQAYSLTYIGKANETLGRSGDALANHSEALALFRRAGDRLWEARSLNSIGYLNASLGETQKALKYFAQALPIMREVNQATEISSTLYNLARLEHKSGDSIGARARIEEALKISENLRTRASGQESRASYFATVHKQYEFYVDLLIQLSKSQPTNSLASVALEMSERARARSLLDSLNEAHANLEEGIDPALLQQERSLRDQLNEKAAQRARLSGDNDSPEAIALSGEVGDLAAQYGRVAAQIRNSNPRYAALTQSQPLTTREIQQQALDDHSLLLEYMLGEERSYLWAVTRDHVWTYELPARARIEEAANRLHNLLTANQPLAGETLQQRQARINDANASLPQVTAAFSELVLGPVIDKLENRRLLIVPDGALQYIPFQALTVPATTGDAAAQAKTFAEPSQQVPLLVDHEIVNEPSASALAVVLSETAQRKSAPNSVAVFANPVFEADDPRVKSQTNEARSPDPSKARVQEAFRDIGQGEGRIPALPASRDEAEAIMAVAPRGTGLKALGFDANRAMISKPDLAQYRFVHFATHGFVDYEHPELSGLVLSLVDKNGQPQDGFLRLHDIYNLKLSANLVVLSACNTGLGKEVKGEGLIGLTRGFMYAGASGVAASLWKVDDEATAELMKHFYEGMFKKGLTPSAALREAQLGMWKQKRWHAPYYWAAFVIQGQYNQKETSGFGVMSTGKWVALSLGLASTLVLVGILIFSRRRTRII